MTTTTTNNDEVPAPEAAPEPPKRDILEILLAASQINAEEAEQARRRQRRAHSTLQEALIDLGTVPQEAIFRAVAEVHNLPFVAVAEDELDKEMIGSMPRKVILRYGFVPVKLEKGVLTAAFSVPPGIRERQQLRTLLGVQRVNPVIATQADVSRASKKLFGLGMETVIEIQQGRMYSGEGPVLNDVSAQDLEEDALDATVGKLLNEFLIEALTLNATDIHIEPFENDVLLRFRVDGMMRDVPAPQGLKALHAALISRVKVQANLNIAEHRLPHDGRVRVTLRGDIFDLRVSILPTRFGETLCMRILNRESMFLELPKLGLGAHDLRIMHRLLDLPHGMVLVTGPTGSGKSTTLYAALDKTDKKQRKVITVEDPVEYQMEGISQIQINAGIGLTFARGLRSILRHDPDIILVGEIRDHETAEIAIRAALTGHLVLSTLHTNDSIGAITRLVDMDIDPFLVASSLSAVIAQRLIRRLCSRCREELPAREVPERIRDEIARVFHLPEPEVKAWRGRGCPECGQTGYRGRIAIYEFFLMDEELEDMVTRGTPSVQVRENARNKGMRNLRMDGWRKVLDGATSIDEILRITTAFDLRYDL